MIERAALALLHRLDPERAHDLSLLALRAGFGPHPGPISSPRLRTRLGGIELPNPVGLAAGYDKNAVALAPLMQTGFGFIEVGAATPRPQPGNPRPRLFRLAADHAAINRFGFNNEGSEAILARLAARPPGVPVGLNLGANRDSADRAADFAALMRAASGHVDFVTVNVSSPNTERLRDLQGKAALTELLAGVMAERGNTPVWLKIAPDMSDDELAEVAETAAAARVDAIIASNTTLSREGLTDRQAGEAGGLSGAPLFVHSTRVLARLSTLLPQMPLVGVGGVATAEQALGKIEAGASAVQLYTALVFEGMSLAVRIPRELDALLTARGYGSVSEAIGARRTDWT